MAKRNSNNSNNKPQDQRHKNQRGKVTSGERYFKKQSKGENLKGKQGKKDSDSDRINYDNARVNRVEEDMTAKGANDISFYNKNPELLKSAGSMPFAAILGNSLYYANAVPGIMQLPFSPSFGAGELSAANQAFDSMFNFLVHANSRTAPYTAPDLGIMCAGGCQVFAMIQALIRAYGLVNHYKVESKYTPDIILSALGFEPNDFRKHLGTLWNTINNLIAQTRQIWIPTSLPIFDRWMWCNSEVYTDALGDRSQLYVYVQDRYFIYSGTRVGTGSALLPVNTNGDPWDSSQAYNIFNPAQNQYTVATWVNVIEKMIKALANSEDRGYVYGDILNAYGRDNIRALTPVQTGFEIAPIYNAEVLSQIENWHPCDMKPSLIAQYEEDFVTVWDPVSNLSTPTLYYNQSETIVNFHLPTQPSPELVMIATRMHSLGYIQTEMGFTFDFDASKNLTGSLEKTKQIIPDTVGSEVPHKPYIFVRTRGTSNGFMKIALDTAAIVYNPEAFSVMAFDWHPFLYQLGGNGAEYEQCKIDMAAGTILTGDKTINQLKQEPTNAYGDFDNWCKFTPNMMRLLHDCALLSEFGVPQF